VIRRPLGDEQVFAKREISRILTFRKKGHFVKRLALRPSRDKTDGDAMKAQMSRFQIHDDLTAPEASLPVLRGAMSGGGQLPNFIGVLAGAPAALRAYARFRSELRNGHLELATLERIALAVSDYHDSEAGIQTHTRTARNAGLGIDEVALAREFDSADESQAALLRYLKAILEERGHAPMHLHEEAREAGWTDEQLLEAIAYLTLETFTAQINVAGEVPADGSTEASRQLRAA
jgi:alkylhydroperoxidase family enzyme